MARNCIKCNWRQFFQTGGEYTIRNLTVFISILTGSFVVLYMVFMGKLTSDIFGLYMLAGGGVYGVGKWQDERTQRERVNK